MIKKIVLLSAYILVQLSVFAQFNFERKDSILVLIDNDTLKNTWSGGFNNPQFSNIDLNQDGIKDIFVFDRSCDQVHTFVYKNENGSLKLKHDPSFESAFPNDFMRYRTALVDYDCDGKEDLFTYFIGGFKVFKNTSNLIDGLQWEETYNHVKSDYQGTLTNLYVSSGDIPAIVDVDGDGDIDVLSFGIDGEVVHYHKNMGMEYFGRCDTLIYEVKNYCWGKFREDLSSNTIVLDDETEPCNGVNNIPIPEKSGSSHVGSTVLALDIDQSGVLDLVLGDATYSNLVLLTNSGSAVNANSVMTSFDVNFPSNTTPVDVPVFPASFYLDLDNDGIKDLVASPNYKGQSNNLQSASWYKNLGVNDLPLFDFQSKDFLQGDMIDVGSGSVPIFFDENGDGLQDLIVSNYYNYKNINEKESKFVLFENIGTPLIPKFKLKDTNYLDMNLSGLELRILPTFGDIDGDGDNDMFVGSQFGSLYFYRNTAGSGNSANLILEGGEYLDENGAPISTGTFSAPVLFDLNDDGLLDLIIGNKAGYLWYYQNVGTSVNPIYRKITETLGNVDTSPISNEGFSQPQFVRLNDTTHLFCGARDGYIHYYNMIDGNIADGDNFNLVSHEYLNIRTGSYSGVALKDINLDQKLDLLLGNDLGGLAQYMGEEFIEIIGLEDHVLEQIAIYPNPSQDILHVNIPGSIFSQLKNGRFEIIDINGKTVLSDQILSTQKSLNISTISNGLYFIKIGNNILDLKLIKN